MVLFYVPAVVQSQLAEIQAFVLSVSEPAIIKI